MELRMNMSRIDPDDPVRKFGSMIIRKVHSCYIEEANPRGTEYEIKREKYSIHIISNNITFCEGMDQKWTICL